MPQTTCIAGDCQAGKIAARGLCAKHYKRQWAAGAPECEAEGCENRGRTAGLCDRHYRAARAERLPTCAAHGCDRKSNVRGLCNSHYYKARGEELGRCPVDGCENMRRCADQPCPTHWERKLRGDQDWDTRPVRRTRQDTGALSTTKDGYLRQRTKSGEWVLQHRLVMADHIGRPLTDDENVHHVNGDRKDNRLANLELWNTSQPAGQRVEDKVQWAREILALYAPDDLPSAV